MACVSHWMEEAGIVIREADMTPGRRTAALPVKCAYSFNNHQPHRLQNVGPGLSENVSASTPSSYRTGHYPAQSACGTCASRPGGLSFRRNEWETG